MLVSFFQYQRKIKKKCFFPVAKCNPSLLLVTMALSIALFKALDLKVFCTKTGFDAKHYHFNISLGKGPGLHVNLL